MASDSEYLVSLGKRFATSAVRELGDTSFKLGTEYAPKLAEYGFDGNKLSELGGKSDELANWISTREDKKEGAHAATRVESDKADEVTKVLRTVAKTAPMVLRDQGIKDLTPESFKPTTKSRSTRGIINQVAEVRPFVQKLDESFKPFFHGESPTALLDNAVAALREADNSQEARRSDTPELTTKLNETKGRVLELVDDLICVAQIAFEKQPDIAARFNKSILERSRKKKGAKSDKGSTDPADPGKAEPTK
jgi:hypothetical protein